jgi:hypothetical protein
MHLLTVPFQPRVNSYYVVYPYLNHEEGWRKFIPGWEPAAEGYA